MKVFVVLLTVIGSILAARKEIGYNELPGVLAKQNASRIVGGGDANIADFPFQVSLQSFGSHFCGGAIIAANKILTAAHCTYGRLASKIYIVAGMTDLNNYGINWQTIGVQLIHQHPGFNYSDLEHDISTLYLEDLLIFSTDVAAINLPHQDDEVNPGSEVTVTGWGATSEGGSRSDILQFVKVNIVSNEDCKKVYGSSSIRNGMLCAGVPQGGKDACQGDSGGPLSELSSTKLVGIVSWGYGCARPNKPGVYTKVSAYRTWIDNH